MTISPFDTVAAVSTPFGKGGVAVIRLSGEEAFSSVARVFFPVGGKSLSDYPYRTAVYGLIRDPESGEVLDDGLCTLFEGPHSFTGEDTAEINCHGGVLVTRNVLEACLRAGARQALAGEFTRRAQMGTQPPLRSGGGAKKFGAGDRVRHSTFGAGTVLSAKDMGGDMLYEVEFDSGTVKKLMGSFARLQAE